MNGVFLLTEKQKNVILKISVIICRILLGAVVGALCGVIGALFSKSIEFVTAFRGVHEWILYLLPIGGAVSVLIYKLCKTENVGTGDALASAAEETEPPATLFAAIFSGSVISHLCGASAGREGAALQLGSVVSSVFSKIISVDEHTRRVLAVCGMGGMFSAVFGTPVGACVFALEIIGNPKFGISAFIPALVSSVAAFFTAEALGAHAERFELVSLPQMSFDSFWKTAVTAVVVGVAGLVFCNAIHWSEKFLHKAVKNPFVRVIAGGIAIILLTMFVGNGDYNGGGVFVIERIFHSGKVYPAAFLLKIIFTVITVASGYKGGEIVPSLFIGATCGGALANVMDFSAPFGAAAGMAAIFSAVTNCPIASVVLCAEMMGIEGTAFFVLSSVLGYFVARKVSLFSAKRVVI